jgi:nucleoside-diphosphate-sugar epimerase
VNDEVAPDRPGGPRGDRPAQSPVILVTGAHGAIGCWATRELVRRGASVVAVDLAAVPVTAFPEFGTSAFLRLDVRHTAALGEAIADLGVTHVLHLAALIGERAEADPALAIEVNALAAARLFAAARTAGVTRTVAMSTKGVLGPLDARYLHPAYEPVPVDHPPSPRTVYEATKYLVEIAIGAERRGGASVAAVRLATTWGPGKSGETHGGFSLHSDVVAAALTGRSTRLDVHRDQGHDLVFYGDVASGLADLLLTDASLSSPVYHLGSGRITTIGEFAGAVEAAFPGVRVETGDGPAGGRNCLLDIGPLTADTGYRPAWPAARALEEVKRLAAIAPG